MVTSCWYSILDINSIGGFKLSDTTPTPASIDVKSETAEVPKPRFKIESIDDLRRILVIAKGGDPDAIQAITKFMDFESTAERSYFPDKTLTLCVGQLLGFAKLYYPDDDQDPFSLIAEVLAVSFMGYKGFKSNQFVDMTRQTPNLDALQTTSEETKQGLVSKILGRGKTE